MRTATQAIDSIVAAMHAGDTFQSGLCKRRTRIAYGVPSDGSQDATEAWGRTKHRVPIDEAPRGALIWWTGGTEGHGHVAVKLHDEGDTILSVDCPQSGHWNFTTIRALELAWPKIRRAGASLDIDGVQVIPDLAGHVKPTPQLDAAIVAVVQAARIRRVGSPSRIKLATFAAYLRKLKAADQRSR